jgi:hypothetical protein
LQASGDAEWREARFYLAASLLHKVKDEEALQTLQRLVLVPLELELASDALGWNPRTWVTAVDAAMARYQRRHLHPDHTEPHTPT